MNILLPLSCIRADVHTSLRRYRRCIEYAHTHDLVIPFIMIITLRSANTHRHLYIVAFIHEFYLPRMHSCAKEKNDSSTHRMRVNSVFSLICIKNKTLSTIERKYLGIKIINILNILKPGFYFQTRKQNEVTHDASKIKNKE